MRVRLQVLVSIQGLVLVAEPYYNEAGYQKQMGTLEGRHNSKQYNESTTLLVLKHMIYSLTHPTPPFESLIRDHFRKRAPAILGRCQRILDQADAASPSDSKTNLSHACAAADVTAATAGAAGAVTVAGAGGEEEAAAEEEESNGAAVGWADRCVALCAGWSTGEDVGEIVRIPSERSPLADIQRDERCPRSEHSFTPRHSLSHSNTFTQ